MLRRLRLCSWCCPQSAFLFLPLEIPRNNRKGGSEAGITRTADFKFSPSSLVTPLALLCHFLLDRTTTLSILLLSHIIHITPLPFHTHLRPSILPLTHIPSRHSLSAIPTPPPSGRPQRRRADAAGPMRRRCAHCPAPDARARQRGREGHFQRHCARLERAARAVAEVRAYKSDRLADEPMNDDWMPPHHCRVVRR